MSEYWTLFKEGVGMYGLFTMLFLVLFVYVLWDKRQQEQRSTIREDKLIAVIGTLSEDVKERLTVIETHLSIKHTKR